MEGFTGAISEDAPVGEYLKANRSVYRGLRNAFNQAQSAYRQLMDSPESMLDSELQSVNNECWLALADQCEEVLTNSSKDVEMLCWFTTAKVFTPSPLETLGEALKAFVDVVTEFGDRMHPRPPQENLKSEGDAANQQEWAEFRTRPLVQLLGESDNSGLLFMPLQNVPLIGDITYARYFSTERSGQIADLKSEALQLLASERDQVITRLHQLENCRILTETLRDLFAEQFKSAGIQPVNFGFLLRSFERMLGALRFMLEEKLTPWPLDPVVEAEVGEGATSVSNDGPDASSGSQASGAASIGNSLMSGGVVSISDALYSRDQAFHNLRQIADYFRQTEPHSPVYMLLERAIRWGYLSLPELMEEMIGDNAAVMDRIQTMAGLETNTKTVIPGVHTTTMSNAAPQNEIKPDLAADSAQAEELESTKNSDENQEKPSQNIASFKW